MAQPLPCFDIPYAKLARLERRGSVRYPINSEAHWTIPVSIGGQPQQAIVRDISASGIGLVLERQVAIGSDVLAELTNASKLLCCMRMMRVVHVRQMVDGRFAVGCRFAAPLDYDLIFALLCK